MPVPVDPLVAFTNLSDSLPLWTARLSELRAHTTAKNVEYSDAFNRLTTVKPRRRKNSSVCSIHTDDLQTDVEPSNPRKRSADDAPSIDSGDHPTLVSRRHRLVIHYDGHTQKSLEEMVRDIGSARNSLRRSKMSQLPLEGFRTGMLGHNSRPGSAIPSLNQEDDNGGEDQLLANIRSARARRGPPPPKVTAPPRESSFDVADKQLELAHGFCESAAYAFLRAGDGAAELRGVEDKFKALLEISLAEVRRLQAEQPEKVEEKPTEEPTPALAVVSVSGDKPDGSTEDAIEVDDGTESVESLDLTAFRSTRRMMRG